MSCLLLRLEGPLQSWGYRSRFTDRDTGLEPTKSGVIGLLCCALGRDRSESVADLAALRMHVRVDREGSILSDYHTAGGGRFRGSREYFAPKSSGAKGENTVLQVKHYLQDASFLVAVEGDGNLLRQLEKALNDPAWPLSLGRRGCPPAQLIGAKTFDGTPQEAFAKEPYPDRANQKPRIVWELEPGVTDGEMRRDVPLAWPDRLNREYTVRFVRSEVIERPAEASP